MNEITFKRYVISSITALTTLLTLVMLYNPNKILADAACGDGRFCGINEGYNATVNQNAKQCFRLGTTWQCDNNGVWDLTKSAFAELRDW